MMIDEKLMYIHEETGASAQKQSGGCTYSFQSVVQHFNEILEENKKLKKDIIKVHEIMKESAVDNLSTIKDALNITNSMRVWNLRYGIRKIIKRVDEVIKESKNSI